MTRSLVTLRGQTGPEFKLEQIGFISYFGSSYAESCFGGESQGDLFTHLMMDERLLIISTFQEFGL